MVSGQNETATRAVICGVGTIFIMGCLYFFGVPLLVIGGILVGTADGDSGLIAGGVVMLVLAIAMVIGGIVTCYFTVKLGNKASAERRQRQAQGGVVHAAPAVTVYPTAQQTPVGPQQYPGQPVQYSYAAAPPVGQYPPSTVTGLPDYTTATTTYPDQSIPPSQDVKY